MQSPSRLGFGVSGPLGRSWFSEEKAAAIIGAAYKGGVRHFDTAPFYGSAQERLGRALNSLGARDVFISTKTGTRRDGGSLVKDFSERAIRNDVERSLADLNRAKLDLLYLHGPSLAQMDAARPIIEKLKGEGLIKAAGVCGDGAPLTRAIESGFDAVMTIYNVVNRDSAAAIADAARRGLMTIAIGPLVDGLVGPGPIPPRSLSDIWRIARSAARRRYDRRALAAARRALGSQDPAGKALSFVLANPSIDIVMTTTTKERHLVSSLAAAARPADPAFHQRIIEMLLTGEAAAPS
ncbi:MAG: aldo/keto reductase [Parvularculaceae bacterium]|nr:aldo/keto reductase [Parvularculaceae bacterium]